MNAYDEGRLGERLAGIFATLAAARHSDLLPLRELETRMKALDSSAGSDVTEENLRKRGELFGTIGTFLHETQASYRSNEAWERPKCQSKVPE
mmetsp:Transcript_8205/g.26893  ORF Transcript_8205/g.26893 Transcript_8205/m.26893 type:complete len:93 (+) Transcript_8205:249-527(+)